MTTDVLRVVLAPGLILVATVAARRFGPAVGGWVAGLPLTSGPVSLVLAIERGQDFAARAALGTLLGLLSFTAFCLVYARVARRGSWVASAAAGLLAWSLAAVVLAPAALGLTSAAAIVTTGLTLASLAMPAARASSRPVKAPPVDLWFRMAAATALVVTLTSLAARLGPRLAGLLSPFPLFAGVLAVFAHRQDGAPSAIRLLRGAVLGSYSFAAFCLVVAVLLPTLPISLVYPLALAAALGVHGLALAVVRRLL